MATATNIAQGKVVAIIGKIIAIAPDGSERILKLGDIVATGTNHRGLNSFMDGDKIELTVEKIGTLRFNVKDDLKRTWARTTRLQHKEKGGEGPHTPQLTGKYAKK